MIKFPEPRRRRTPPPQITAYQLAKYLHADRHTILKLYEQITGEPLKPVTLHYTDDRPRKTNIRRLRPIPEEVAREIIRRVMTQRAS